jgi:hypothetical protein
LLSYENSKRFTSKPVHAGRFRKIFYVIARTFGRQERGMWKEIEAIDWTRVQRGKLNGNSWQMKKNGGMFQSGFDVGGGC